jgi:hypothetical protein
MKKIDFNIWNTKLETFCENSIDPFQDPFFSFIAKKYQFFHLSLHLEPWMKNEPCQKPPLYKKLRNYKKFLLRFLMSNFNISCRFDKVLSFAQFACMYICVLRGYRFVHYLLQEFSGFKLFQSEAMYVGKANVFWV